MILCRVVKRFPSRPMPDPVARLRSDFCAFQGNLSFFSKNILGKSTPAIPSEEAACLSAACP